MTNVHACLVHESPECVADLVANLRHLDPSSVVLLYDGSKDQALLRAGGLPETEGVLVHPAPRPMRWGRLHDFAFDSMRMALDAVDFTSITIVDSDQLLMRAGYSGALARQLSGNPGLGCLFNEGGGPQPRATRSHVARAAWHELDMWRPFLRRFGSGERIFPQWSFWPSTVFTRDAVEDLVQLADDPQLRVLLARTRLWATEEVVLPTLVALTGHRLEQNRCSSDLVRFRVQWTPAQIERAFEQDDVFWLHPVPRKHEDPTRDLVRRRYDGYPAVVRTSSRAEEPRMDEIPARLTAGPDVTAATTPLPPPQVPLQALALLDRMERVEGWFSRAEGELLLGAAVLALTTMQAPRTIVEIGSFCGRSTTLLGGAIRSVDPTARVYAVDPHLGTTGSSDTGMQQGRPTWEAFQATIEQAALTDVVRPLKLCSYDVDWDRPISMLFLDGLHDFASVASDYSHFEPFLVPGSVVGFHDYASYYPGIVGFVDHLVSAGTLTWIDRAESCAVLRFVRRIGAPSMHALLEEMDVVDGWLSRDEAAFLGLLATEATSAPDQCVVEIGSYCGRGTVVLARASAHSEGTQVYAVDTFDGVVGALDQHLTQGEPTLARFREAVERVGVAGNVVAIESRATEVEWDRPLSLLVVDGLHDYESARADFEHFGPFVVPGGSVAFHDYADYYPGVRRLVAETAASPEWGELEVVGTLARLRRVAPSPAGPAAARTQVREPVRRTTAGRTSTVAVRHEAADPATPVVSCVMPTYDRRRFVPQAVAYFLAQDGPASELIVVDDGPRPVEDLLPQHPSVRYLRLDRRATIGAKRNLACEAARGEYVAHWDDDDWYAPSRLRVQLDVLRSSSRSLAGLSRFLYWDPSTDRAWTYAYPEQSTRPWVHDPTVMVRQETWARHKYPNVSHGLDARWLWGRVKEPPIVIDDTSLYVGLLHDTNTSQKQTASSWWHPCPPASVHELISDTEFYTDFTGTRSGS